MVDRQTRKDLSKLLNCIVTDLNNRKEVLEFPVSHIDLPVKIKGRWHTAFIYLQIHTIAELLDFYRRRGVRGFLYTPNVGKIMILRLAEAMSKQFSIVLA